MESWNPWHVTALGQRGDTLFRRWQRRAVPAVIPRLGWSSQAKVAPFSSERVAEML
jgi:hypothetical protein